MKHAGTYGWIQEGFRVPRPGVHLVDTWVGVCLGVGGDIDLGDL